MALGQQEPVVAGVFHQAPAGLDEALLEAGERPGVDPRRQDEPPPQCSAMMLEQIAEMGCSGAA